MLNTPGSMEFQKLINGVRNDIPNTHLNETLSETGSLSMKICVKKTCHQLINRKSYIFSLPRSGRPALLTDELMTEIKLILNNLQISGCAISRKVVISVRNGILASRCPEKITKNGGRITFSIKWARNVLKLMNWVKRKRTTEKRAMNPALYDEL